MNGRSSPGGHGRAQGGTISNLRRFRRYGRPHRLVLFSGILLRMGELGADLAQPWPLAIVVDSVFGKLPVHGPLGTFLRPFAGSRATLLTAAVVASVVLAGASGFFDYLGDRLMNGAGERMTAAIRADLFAHLHRLPASYHDGHLVGELASRVSTDTDRIEDALVDVFSTLLPGLLNIVGLLAVVLIVDWRLGLLMAASAPLVGLTFARYTRLTREAARIRRAREGDLTARVVEVLSGVRTVHALGGHDLHDEQFEVVNGRTLAAGLRAVDLLARFTPLVEACAAVGTAILLWVGGWGVLHGMWTLGLLLVVLSYMRNMLKPIRALSNLSLTFARASASAERVAAVLEEPTFATTLWALGGPRQLHRVPAPSRARGRIELQGVTFGYGRSIVLDAVDLRAEPGERIAIVGPNGAGKSSLLALFARLYDPDEGVILLDGLPIERAPLEWFRRQVAVVLQETFLFSGTLWDNIRYGNPSASPEDIERAAEGALVAAFAEQLPAGYQTMLGEAGVGLSGGQRQRVAIARALLRRAPVVLLDEPTSGLDMAAEELVIEGLRTLVEGSTVVMVTHRPALLDLADRTLILRDGKLIPQAVRDRLGARAG